jgi:hypothetical protein
MQTLADLGLIGLGLSMLAGAAWFMAALRATGARRRDRGLPFDPERIGLMTMSSVVIVFGVHSLIDWTWFVPGNTVVALLCAGWVAGRGPLRDRLAKASGAAIAQRRPGRPLRERLAGFRPTRGAVGTAAGVVILALVTSWAALQPVRAQHAEDAAVDALTVGNFKGAASNARVAAARNPLSLEPLWDLAFIEDARDNKHAAVASLAQAARRQPANAEAWRRLGRYRLSVLDDPKSALEAFRAAYFLDPSSLQSGSDLIEAQRALHAPS